MRSRPSLLLCAAAAFVSAGCEVHEHGYVSGPAALQGEVAVDEPQGEVIEGPGVAAIDVEPDPTQRVYVYDEGFPPGVYLYDNYYYYGGYRYPHDLFINQYVQRNVQQHRYVNVEDNRRQGQKLEQGQRAEFAKTHGVRQKPAARTEAKPAQPRVQTPVRQPEAARPEVQRPENRTPANEERRPAVQQPEKAAAEPRVERPENRTPANEQRRPAVQQPEKPAAEPRVERPANPAPANEERRDVQRPATPENKQAPANEERRDVQRPATPENKQAPAREPSKPNPEEQKRDEGK